MIEALLAGQGGAAGAWLCDDGGRTPLICGAQEGHMAVCAMLLRHALGEGDAAAAIERAVSECLAKGVGTGDIGGSAGTDEVVQRVCARIAEANASSPLAGTA